MSSRDVNCSCSTLFLSPRFAGDEILVWGQSCRKRHTYCIVAPHGSLVLRDSFLTLSRGKAVQGKLQDAVHFISAVLATCIILAQRLCMFSPVNTVDLNCVRRFCLV